MTTDDTAAGALSAGWAHLARAEWEAARASFEFATPSPEACEGLSWAAWWRDDAATVFDARERAYAGYREAGDDIAAARMAVWLACDSLDFRAAPAAAGGWLARAHRLLDPLDPVGEHGWLAFFDGYLAAGAGDDGRAAECARRATALGSALGIADLEMLGLALEGSTLVASADVDEGMRRLDEATVAALEVRATVPIAGAWACCFAVTACCAVRDYGRAVQWCDRIAAFAERYGSRYMLAFCRAEYGTVHLWRGAWPQAERMLEDAIEDFSRSRPGLTAGPQVALAELRRRQGREREAERLLEQAGPSPGALLGRAWLAYGRGDHRRATELGERILRRLPASAPVARAPVLELLVRARVARGDHERCEPELEALRSIAQRVGTEPLLAAADFCTGALAAARGEHELARAHLEDAVDAHERSGGGYEAAHGRLALAESLAALGRPGDADRERTAARAQLGALAATAPSGRAPGAPVLSPREREVLAHVAAGLSNRAIAERLVVSEHTVHRHVTNVLRKLGLPTRAAAAAHAARHGLLDP